MNPANPLESVYFINLPQDFHFSAKALSLDTAVPLPVQRKDGEENLDLKELSEEQILSGILTVLAYDSKNQNLAYYRKLITEIRPNIKKELAEAAILKTKNEDWDLAEEIWRAVKGLDPESKAITLNMAIFFDQRADADRKDSLHDDADAYDADAESYYIQAMEAEPPLPDSFFNAGFFYLKQHKYREAKDSFETFVALNAGATQEELGENGEYKLNRAQEILENIKNQNMDDARFKNAYDLISSGEEEKGMEEIKLFLQNNPKVWNAWFLLGWALRKLERFEDAKQAFLEALKNGGDKNSDTYNELSLCLVAEHKFDEAKSALQKALAIDSDSTKILSNLGYIALAQDNEEEARKYFLIVLELDPKDAIAAAELAKLEK